MPLKGGKKNIGKNIKELYHANEKREAEGKSPRPRAQMIAIAESVARKGDGKKPTKKKQIRR